MSATVVLGQQGRLVIPADVRSAIGLRPGDALHLRLDGNRIVLERPADAVAELRSLGCGLGTGSLVDELLAERRAAATVGG